MGIHQPTPTSDLGRYIDDPPAARAIEAWAREKAAAVEVPDEPWRRRGGSGAILARLRIHVGEHGPLDILVKVCSQGSPAHEPENHEVAWALSPGFAERHLLRQVFAPKVMNDGRALMFLKTSQALLHGRTLGELPPK